MNQVIQLPAPKVTYADKPLCLNPSLLPLETAQQQRINYFITEELSYRPCDYQHINHEIKRQSKELTETYAQQGLKINYTTIKKQAEDILSAKTSLPQFTICNLDIEKDLPKVGHGLFINEPVKQFQVIGFFSGIIIPVEMQSKQLTNGFAHRLSKNFLLSVEKRGIMTFMQSAPNKDEENLADILQRFDEVLSNTHLSPNQVHTIHRQRQNIICENEWQNLDTTPAIKQSIAGENCIPIPIVTGHKKTQTPLLVIIAKKDIPAKTQLLLNYGFVYFHAQKIYPEYFLTNEQEGLVLSHQQYLRPAFGPIHIIDLPHSPIINWQPYFDKLDQQTLPIKLGNKTVDISTEKLKQALIKANMLPK